MEIFFCECVRARRTRLHRGFSVIVKAGSGILNVVLGRSDTHQRERTWRWRNLTSNTQEASFIDRNQLFFLGKKTIPYKISMIFKDLPAKEDASCFQSTIPVKQGD